EGQRLELAEGLRAPRLLPERDGEGGQPDRLGCLLISPAQAPVARRAEELTRDVDVARGARRALGHLQAERVVDPSLHLFELIAVRVQLWQGLSGGGDVFDRVLDEAVGDSERRR